MDATALIVTCPGTSGHRLIAAAGMDVTQILMLAGAVVGVTIVLLSTRRRLSESRRSPQVSARELYAKCETDRKTTRDIEDVMLELDQLSRQIHGRIDTKLARLEAVIRDADQRIEKLSRLSSGTQSRPSVEITLDREDPFSPAADESAVSDKPEICAGPKANDGMGGAIHRLAERGLSPSQIAKEVGKLPGEVELIIALRKARLEGERPHGLAASVPPTPGS